MNADFGFAQLSALLPTFILISLRVGVTFASIPAPFGSMAPARVRLALSLVVSAALFAGHVGDVPPFPLEAVAVVVAGVGEVLVGTVIGLTARVTLAAADVAGNAAGNAMGLGFASSVDPIHGESALPTSRLLSALSVVIFLGVDGHHTVLAGLARSFDALPVGNGHAVIAQKGVILLGSDLLARGLQVAAPVVSSMFIVSIGSGLVSRAAPRVNLFSLSFAVASAAGLLVMWVSTRSIATALSAHIARLDEALSVVLGGFGG